MMIMMMMMMIIIIMFWGKSIRSIVKIRIFQQITT